MNLEQDCGDLLRQLFVSGEVTGGLYCGKCMLSMIGAGRICEAC